MNGNSHVALFKTPFVLAFRCEIICDIVGLCTDDCICKVDVATSWDDIVDILVPAAGQWIESQS